MVPVECVVDIGLGEVDKDGWKGTHRWKELSRMGCRDGDREIKRVKLKGNGRQNRNSQMEISRWKYSDKYTQTEAG